MTIPSTIKTVTSKAVLSMVRGASFFRMIIKILIFQQLAHIYSQECRPRPRHLARPVPHIRVKLVCFTGITVQFGAVLLAAN